MWKMVRNVLVVCMIATVSFAGDCGDDDDNMMMGMKEAPEAAA